MNTYDPNPTLSTTTKDNLKTKIDEEIHRIIGPVNNERQKRGISTLSDDIIQQGLSTTEVSYYRQVIRNQINEQKATLIAHYYTAPEIQQLAEETGGFVGDSLEMAKFGANSDSQTLMVCGVRFMGETAKIISPEKTVLMPTLEATCSLDLGCPIDEFNSFCRQYPDRTVVVYANTSAEIKARADWVVTSSIAVDVVEHLDAQGKKILWAPDRYLGDYIKKQTNADMVLWDGSCVVHEEFKYQRLMEMKSLYPDSAVLVHPESPADVIRVATLVGSTSQLIKAAKTLPHKQMIVATDQGIFYKMQQAAPDKELILAPTSGHGASCRSCGQCPWMGLNNLSLLATSFIDKHNEIHIPEYIIEKARQSIDRMLTFQM